MGFVVSQTEFVTGSGRTIVHHQPDRVSGRRLQHTQREEGTVMATVKSDDGTLIDYDIQGAGPPVVLICAGPTDRSSNAGLADLLAATCTVINYDRR